MLCLRDLRQNVQIKKIFLNVKNKHNALFKPCRGICEWKFAAQNLILKYIHCIYESKGHKLILITEQIIEIYNIVECKRKKQLGFILNLMQFSSGTDCIHSD